LKFSFDSCGFIIWYHLWHEVGSVIYCCCWASPVQSLSGLSSAGLKTIFYCPNFWDSPNMEDQVPIFISPRKKGGPVKPPGTGFPFCCL
jgi:hypothetical protein